MTLQKGQRLICPWCSKMITGLSSSKTLRLSASISRSGLLIDLVSGQFDWCCCHDDLQRMQNMKSHVKHVTKSFFLFWEEIERNLNSLLKDFFLLLFTEQTVSQSGWGHQIKLGLSATSRFFKTFSKRGTREGTKFSISSNVRLLFPTGTKRQFPDGQVTGTLPLMTLQCAYSSIHCRQNWQPHTPIWYHSFGIWRHNKHVPSSLVTVSFDSGIANWTSSILFLWTILGIIFFQLRRFQLDLLMEVSTLVILLYAVRCAIRTEQEL